MKLLFVCAILLLGVCASAEPLLSQPVSHTDRQIEGWAIRVDDRLLTGADAETGGRALKLLSVRLFEITLVVPQPALDKLRAIPIQLDLGYGDLHFMQYHPSAGWLRDHGYDPHLEKCVHIPEAAQFLSPYENHRQPCVVLHELAHGYHDKYLGFDNARIDGAFEKFKSGGKYQSVLTVGGSLQEHYALTNAKEFFAEMTECYFGTNDFYPFVSGELRRDEPELFGMLEEIWGPLPKRQ